MEWQFFGYEHRCEADLRTCGKAPARLLRAAGACRRRGCRRDRLEGGASATQARGTEMNMGDTAAGRHPDSGSARALRTVSDALRAYVGKRHRDGRPISTAMAESAVNQILNHRMCKRQQMRWSPRGAHLLAQVRCAAINGDLRERLAAFRRRMEELPAEVAEFLERLGRIAEAEADGAILRCKTGPIPEQQRHLSIRATKTM